MIKRIFSMFLTVIFLAFMGITAFAEKSDVSDIVNSVFITENQKVLFDEDFLNNAGTTSVDWFVIALRISGIDAEYDKYLDAISVYVNEKYETENRLHRVKATEWHRIALAVEACGGDARNLDGIDLVKDGVYDFDLDKQGINAYIWALVTLSAEDYEIPENPLNTKESITEKILSYQLSDGGFALSGESGDVDVTAEVVTALAPYKDNDRVKTSIDKAVAFIKSKKHSDGSFESYGVKNCESACQALIALNAVGENTEGIFENILSFKTDDGFSHLADGKTNFLATQQAILALGALNKEGYVYDFLGDDIAEAKELSESDRELIKGFTEKVNASDIDTIKRLLQTVEAVKPDDEAVLKTTLEMALDKAETKLEGIAWFNENVSEIQKNGVSIKDKNTIQLLNVYYEEFSKEDKKLLDDSDGFVKIKAEYNILRRKYGILYVISIVILLSVILLVANRKKRRKDEE